MKGRSLAKRIVPFDDVDRPRTPGVSDQDSGTSGQGGLRPGEEVLGAAADFDEDLAGAMRAPGRDGEDTDRADA